MPSPSSRSAEQIRRTIDLALSGEVKTQDAPFLLNRCIANRQNGAMAWEIVRRQWPELLERFPDNTIVRMVGSITTLTTPRASSPTCRGSSPSIRSRKPPRRSSSCSNASGSMPSCAPAKPSRWPQHWPS